MAEDQDKTEQPSAFRLKEAREQGQVARSTEVTAVICLIVFSCALCAGLAGIARAFADGMRATLLMSGTTPTLGAGFLRWLDGVFAPAWQAMAPSLLALVVAAVTGNMLQTGPVFSLAPLKPDASRLNPANGIKRIFSLRTLWDMCRLLLKLAAVAALLLWMSHALWHPLLASATSSPPAIPTELSRLFTHLVKWLLTVFFLIALLDLLFTRRELIRKLRMSRRELKDEHKRQEGDPTIRSKRRRLARDMLKRIQSVARVPAADVVVTNPTHVAVALQYRRARMIAPLVLSKGSGWLSARIRKVAVRHGVPIVRSPALARALFRECGLDESVPVAHYREVGVIYRWVMSRPGHKVHT